jgi:hypothetical protein
LIWYVIRFKNCIYTVKKMCCVSARKLSINNYAWGLLKATKKLYLVHQNWKEANNSYVGYPTNLQAEPKILKKLLELQIYQSERKISQKKNCSSYLRSEKEPKICMKATQQICRLDPKSLKNYRNIKSTNQNEKFPKKNMFSNLKG